MGLFELFGLLSFVQLGGVKILVGLQCSRLRGSGLHGIACEVNRMLRGERWPLFNNGTGLVDSCALSYGCCA